MSRLIGLPKKGFPALSIPLPPALSPRRRSHDVFRFYSSQPEKFYAFASDVLYANGLLIIINGRILAKIAKIRKFVPAVQDLLPKTEVGSNFGPARGASQTNKVTVQTRCLFSSLSLI